MPRFGFAMQINMLMQMRDASGARKFFSRKFSRTLVPRGRAPHLT
jgi:hypothetical protein